MPDYFTGSAATDDLYREGRYNEMRARGVYGYGSPEMMEAQRLDDLAIATAKAESIDEGYQKAMKDSAMIGDSGYERIEADFYPTPPENVDCLLEHFTPHGGSNLIWEPACGKGDISKRLMDYGYETLSSDLYNQGFGTPGMDFLARTDLPNPNIRAIVTNPPYADGLAEKFARHAIKLMKPVRGQVAMFLRNEFDCGKGRMDLFGLPPFHKKIVVTKRPRWIEGSTGSPRHNYSWFIWDWRHKAGSAGIAYSHPDFAPGPLSK
jgi:hypothetical protein